MTEKEVKELEGILFGAGIIEYDKETEKCYVKILRHDYIEFINKLREKIIKED